MKGTLILNQEQVKRKIQRMAYQIWERNFNLSGIVLIGIKQNGLHFAEAMAEILQKTSEMDVQVYSLSINKINPLESPLETNFDIKNISDKALILVDDVQNSGKTMMYAIRHFLDYDFKMLQCAVLVDRSHNSFPVKADFIGLSLSTTLQEHVDVVHQNGTFEVFLH